jgi:hypothetical protein
LIHFFLEKQLSQRRKSFKPKETTQANWPVYCSVHSLHRQTSASRDTGVLRSNGTDQSLTTVWIRSKHWFRHYVLPRGHARTRKELDGSRPFAKKFSLTKTTKTGPSFQNP